LVLTGGGARAAYQVGAARALSEIIRTEALPFQVLSGASAGAINVTTLGARASSFRAGAQQLWETWESLFPERVYRTDVGSLASIGTRWMKDLAGGGHLGSGAINHLLDASPLRTLLERRLELPLLGENIAAGRLRGISVTATNYHTGSAVTFFEGVPSIEPWTRSTRLGMRETLTVDHVMASAAIPLFFPPVRLNGAYFGDGCIRMSWPLSAAIHLGADKLLAIGIRYIRSPDQTAQLNQKDQNREPALSEIGGVLMNSIFLDSLEGDVERLERINKTLGLLTSEQNGKLEQPLRSIPILVLRPSQDLGLLAQPREVRLPKTLRYLFRGIGVHGNRGGDLLSYLAFEPDYVGKLLDLGYRDTLARRHEVEAFFESP
jgi:NTE family protein